MIARRHLFEPIQQPCRKHSRFHGLWWRITCLFLVALPTLATPVGANDNGSISGVIDLALTADGHLAGRIQGRSNQAVAGTLVNLTQNGGLVAQSRSRADGSFAFAGVATGVYELSSANWRRNVRVWAVNAAPPSTRESTVIVLDEVPVSVPQSPEWNEFALAQSRKGAGKTEAANVRPASWTESVPFNGEPQWGTPMPDGGTAPALLPQSLGDSSAAAVDGAQFDPYSGQAVSAQPVPEIVDFGCDGCDGQALPFCPPARYPSGPTIGEAVTATLVITSVVLGGVAIYEVSNERDRINRPSSP
jgi:hypothetical protein